jgi:hypothetical protein
VSPFRKLLILYLYDKYCGNKLLKSTGSRILFFQASLPASPVSYGLRRLGLGVVYMLIHLIGAMYFPLMWPASPAFLTHNILLRFLLLGLWGKVKQNNIQ